MRADEAGLARLMALAQRGDKAAYASLLKFCAGWLGRYYSRRVPPCRRDDLVQETLLSLHRKLGSYDPQRDFIPWLAAIARYRWVDHLRAVYRSDEVALEADLASPDDDEPATARISLEKLFRQLPQGQATVIEMVKIEGLSVAEAARNTGQSEPLVKVNIHRGLKRLAALIEKAD